MLVRLTVWEACLGRRMSDKKLSAALPPSSAALRAAMRSHFPRKRGQTQHQTFVSPVYGGVAAQL